MRSSSATSLAAPSSESNPRPSFFFSSMRAKTCSAERSCLFERMSSTINWTVDTGKITSLDWFVVDELRNLSLLFDGDIGDFEGNVEVHQCSLYGTLIWHSYVAMLWRGRRADNAPCPKDIRVSSPHRLYLQNNRY